MQLPPREMPPRGKGQMILVFHLLETHQTTRTKRMERVLLHSSLFHRQILTP